MYERVVHAIPNIFLLYFERATRSYAEQIEDRELTSGLVLEYITILFHIFAILRNSHRP